MRRALMLPLACAAAVAASPATAKNWVTLDYQIGRGGHWLDRDTVRRDGDLVYFESSARLGNRVYPDDATPGVPQAYNCRTKLLHPVRDGQPGEGRPVQGPGATAYDIALCR